MIILDTDIMVDLLRKYKPALRWLDSLNKEEIILPGFVAMELIQGCRDKQEQEKVEKELVNYRMAWPSAEIYNEVISVFTRFHLSHNLGIIDAIIGQMTVVLNLPLYTFNQKHYEAIPNIKTIQPYKKA